MPKVKEWCFMSAIGMPRVPEVNANGSEADQTRLFGRVFKDHRRCLATGEFDDGHRVLTSPIQKIDWESRTVTTRSGTTYKLDGMPDSYYIKWLQDNNEWDKRSKDLLPPVSQLN